MIRYILNKPSRLYKNWIVHNIIAHPIMQILMLLGLNEVATYIHDNTLPDFEDQ